MVQHYSNDELVLRLLFRIDNGYLPTPIESSFIRSCIFLDCRGSGLKVLPKSIARLTNLKWLILSGTYIEELPDTIGQLTHLEMLNISRTKVSSLTETIGKLPNLTWLDISFTSISFLPESLKHLCKLTVLLIGNTKISLLPNWVGGYLSLKYLDLKNLSLLQIPESVALMGLPFIENPYDSAENIGINLFGTSLGLQNRFVFLETPSLIPTLYKSAKMLPFGECRVIFLGDGGVGKSYTIIRFRKNGAKERKGFLYFTHRTSGIEIRDYRLKTEAGNFVIHFWDFGGQQLHYSMHRCFMTREACYVVTVSTRDPKANAQARYWLLNVATFAPNSPVLLLVNCWGKDDGTRTIDEFQLRNEFPNIQSIAYCSVKEAEDSEFIEKTMLPITQMVINSDGCSKLVPYKWIQVKSEIEKARAHADYMKKDTYHAICHEAGIESAQIPELLSCFNNLGICFSYHSNPENGAELTDYKLLDPTWLTNAIYAIIEEGKVYATEGRIKRSAISQMLCNKAPDRIMGDTYHRTAPEKTYQPHECVYIIDIAILHGLCYSINEEQLFFPSLCETNTPSAALPSNCVYNLHVSYQLSYTFLPDSVVHQLMIRCMQEGINVEKTWLKGLVLTIWAQHKAVICIGNDEKTLLIDIYSTTNTPAYQLFWMLRKEISSINQKLNLSPEEFIRDGNTTYPLKAVLLAAQDNGYVYGTSGKRNARELLGEYYEECFIQTMQTEDDNLIIPISPGSYHVYNKNAPELRHALYEAYNRTCPYCCNIIKTIREMQIDHIFPSKYKDREDLRIYIDYLRSHGFDVNKPDYIENYFPAHSYCNLDKGNNTHQYSLLYWHDIARQHTPRVLRLLHEYRNTRKEQW